MTDPSAADHLAEIDARLDAHLSAVREHAALVRRAVATDAAELAARLEPAPEPEAGFEPPVDPEFASPTEFDSTEP